MRLVNDIHPLSSHQRIFDPTHLSDETASSSCNITGINSCFGRQTRDSSLDEAQCCNLLTQTATLVAISFSDPFLSGHTRPRHPSSSQFILRSPLIDSCANTLHLPI